MTRASVAALAFQHGAVQQRLSIRGGRAESMRVAFMSDVDADAFTLTLLGNGVSVRMATVEGLPVVSVPLASE